MPTIGKGIAETQNRQTNLISLSSMFARRMLQSGTQPHACGGLPLLRSSHDRNTRLRGCAN
jgi:hypothetical protein